MTGLPIIFLEFRIDEYKNIQITEGARRIFAETVSDYVFEDAAPFPSQRLLSTRRNTDRGRNDLWTTYHVVLENIMKGGLRGHNSKHRRMKTRAIKNIDRNNKLNQALWTLTEKMAEIKI